MASIARCRFPDRPPCMTRPSCRNSNNESCICTPFPKRKAEEISTCQMISIRIIKLLSLHWFPWVGLTSPESKIWISTTTRIYLVGKEHVSHRRRNEKFISFACILTPFPLEFALDIKDGDVVSPWLRGNIKLSRTHNAGDRDMQRERRMFI